MSGSSVASAQSGSNGDEPVAPDFAAVTSVTPTGQPLLASPTLMVACVTESSGPPLTYTIQQVSIPAGGPDGDSIGNVQQRRDLAPYLANTAYLGLDNAQISGKAQEIAGLRTNLYDIAVQIQQWVHQSMTPTPTIGLPRSAVQILDDRRGVCRDYALLFTALARAAHVPTRLCAGLVGYRGRFFYHAWAESYIGGAIGWMPFDPTLNELPVDASHIPLVKGDPVNLYDLVGNIGAIKVVIVRCEQ
jgi:transglutaminase-like putative cysteine protease